MIRAKGPIPPVIVEFPSSTDEAAAALKEREQHLRNIRWFSRHAAEIGRDHVGKYVCVAGEELFVGNELEEVHARAAGTHPDEHGAIFTKYISTHRGPKVYANRRLLDVE